MLPMASVKLRAAHDPARSIPPGFGRPCATIMAPAAATITMAVLILDHTTASYQPAEQGVGSHADASVSFRNCDEMMYGVSRYIGSSTTAVQISMSRPVGSLKRSTYSSSDAFSLYGMPF